MSSAMINSPKKLQCSAVSKRINPVTQTADVEVNKVSIQCVALPDSEASGKDKKKAPRSISKKKTAGIIQGFGDMLIELICLIIKFSRLFRLGIIDFDR
tara:strand:- start:4785 stop:5081 length:297 start_codon:yes stop_codon:yes gene_type:complete